METDEKRRNSRRQSTRLLARDFYTGETLQIRPSDSRPTIARGTMRDRIDMQRMGKKQELRRSFRQLSTISFTSCVMGNWEILLTANGPALINGGPSGIFWSLVWSWTGQLFVIMSLAEMSSMAPTSAGQYHWVSEFSPPGWQRFLSFCTGWLSTMAWQSVVAVDCYIIAGIIQALIQLSHPAYDPTRWQATLLTIATAVGLCLFNIFAASQLSLLEGVFAVCHVFLFVPIVVMLWILAPTSNVQEAFFTFTNQGGWPSTALSLLIGQVPMIFTTLGSDSVAHLAEEVENAALVVPQAMLWSYLVNAPLGLVMALTIIFNIGPVERAIQSSYPFVYMFETALQDTQATSAFTIIMLVLLAMVTVSVIASTSRQMFAFARDNGLPSSRWLKRVSVKYNVPVNAIIATAGFTIALSLINIGSSVAFNAVLSLSTTALMASYLISIGCVTRKRLTHETLPYAPWSLGRYGLPINLIALGYATWSFFWAFWPGEYHVTAGNMNWACLIFVGFVAWACVMFRLSSLRRRDKYEGPVARVQVWMNEW
ncbi:GABA permease-like protein [Hortaea werneckii]|uniref:Amino acid permease/ SLC12A domain-containing protein n=2 Tax=Hortaea werneckii TaxID=91943 RepID=A0A3M7ENN0_HORWE|nr:GABA permease-like protein [Hortaea werneckii]KAI6862108.1 GABA permease-like protein [Hortaea werneckii]KAI7202817.1 GABA permease-like protein [Hortaea werneckii]KAI7563649.1 GABA permease-like protein [Hortaea werneckii]KAI7609187.1 GABA permease-like protein [Hortaea werneckii]